MPLLKFESVSKVFSGEVPVSALENINLSFDVGCFVALVGASGSGKTTLLNLASGLDFPTSGKITVAGEVLNNQSHTQLSLFRRNHLGFIFQSYNLFPTLTTVENVEYTRLIRGDDARVSRKKSLEALESVGLLEKQNVFPSKLSGGQQQRVAVARALASEPAIIFADEPTANLDSVTGKSLIDLFRNLNIEKNISFVFSTHDRDLIESVKTVVNIKSGKIQN
jgi:putative ABC transport system ATP-binding protein